MLTWLRGVGDGKLGKAFRQVLARPMIENSRVGNDEGSRHSTRMPGAPPNPN
jgi:hypothetical protein